MAFMSTQVGGHQFPITDKAKIFKIGDMIRGNDGSEWIYVKAGEAVGVAGMLVTYDESYSALKMTKTNVDAGHSIGVCPQIVAANDYVFVQRSGVIPALAVLASCVADVALYTSATAGYADDTSTSQTKINNLVITTTRGGTDGVAPALAKGAITGNAP